MTRAHLTYGANREARRFDGIDVTEPVAGFYRGKLVSGGVRGGIHLWYGPPHDPVTGEELDRSWRWQAHFDGEPVAFDRVWPQCAGDPITETEYRRYVARTRWAQEHAPTTAYAQRGMRLDPLDPATPLDF